MAEQTTDSPPQSRGTAMFVAYNLALVLLLPLLALYLLYRLLEPRRRLTGLGERLGNILGATAGLEGDDPIVWVHAVSAGEMAAVAPVIREIRVREPITRIAISTVTGTGREMVGKLGLDPDALFFFPFDLPGIVDRVLAAVRPDVLVVVETELWPNLLHAARRRGTRVIVVNGRVSDRSFPRARALRAVYAWMLGNIERICAQSQEDADRFVALGADPATVTVTGNSKFDERFPSVNDAEVSKFRQDFGFRREAPVLVAASTHEGEEELALQAFTRLRVTHADLQLVIAPRHPERGGRVEEIVHGHGYGAYRRSRALNGGGGDPLAPERGPQCCVAVLDTMGELARVYAIATVAFVGKSLMKGGGHNILQPIALGKPALFGPYMENFRDIAAICKREQVGFEVAEVLHVGPWSRRAARR